MRFWNEWEGRGGMEGREKEVKSERGRERVIEEGRIKEGGSRKTERWENGGK